MNMTLRGILVVSVVAVTSAMMFSWPGARASGAGEGGRAWPDVRDEVWAAECGACHVAFPPRLLPAASWERIMNGLSDHFGENAELAPETAARIRAYLKAHAASARGLGWGYDGEDDKLLDKDPSASLRITKTAWFRRKHDEVRASVWTRESVGSPANCGACHRGADQGDFNEHRVKIPK